MGDVCKRAIKPRRAGSGVAFEPPPSTAERLRRALEIRDNLTANLAKLDALIAADARLYADERGEFIRPTVEQLRKRLGGEAC